MTTTSSASPTSAFTDVAHIAIPSITEPLFVPDYTQRYSRDELINIGQTLICRDVPPPTPRLRPLSDPQTFRPRIREAITRDVEGRVRPHISWKWRRLLSRTNPSACSDAQRYDLIRRCAALEESAYHDIEVEIVADVTKYCVENLILKLTDPRYSERLSSSCKFYLDTAEVSLYQGLDALGVHV